MIPFNRVIKTLQFYGLNGKAENLQRKLVDASEAEILRYVEACLRTLRIRAAACQMQLSEEEAVAINEYLESL